MKFSMVHHNEVGVVSVSYSLIFSVKCTRYSHLFIVTYRHYQWYWDEQQIIFIFMLHLINLAQANERLSMKQKRKEEA